ncbi:hypothetical protein HDV01_000765 [Terramyces sp. JEL0728]|nr:hypothetical protein HDV01_000765 [Terramyces sp. JEL0728]
MKFTVILSVLLSLVSAAALPQATDSAGDDAAVPQFLNPAAGGRSKVGGNQQ